MMPDELIPYLLQRLGIKKDSLTEALIMMSLFPIVIFIMLQFFIHDTF